MSHWYDNVHTTAFTPRDYQVELLASAMEQNIMVCVGHKSSKEFIALKLIQELARDLRKASSKTNPKKYTIYVTNSNGETAYNLIHHLTDLKVYLHDNDDADADSKSTDNINDSASPNNDSVSYDNYQVHILSAKHIIEDLREGKLKLTNINLLVVEDCHDVGQQDTLFGIFNEFYKDCSSKPKVLSLAGPLHSAGCLPIDLKGILDIFETNLHCKTETASDIVTVLRYCTKPTEFILQCAPSTRDELTCLLEEIIITKKNFLKDHRFDPSEIYSDEFSEELQGIPDPKIEPIKFLDNYLEVLYEMGPWCADRIALNLLSQIEKQKVKTPYERHFLLLCLVSTTLVEIRSYCDYSFHQLANEKERIEQYSSPKVLRLIEVLRLYQPVEVKTENKSLAIISQDLETMDFQKLQQTLESTFQCIEKNENREVRDVLDNLENIVHVELPIKHTIPVINSTSSQFKYESNRRKITNSTILNKDDNNFKNKRNANNSRQRRRYFTPGNNAGRKRHNKDNTNESEALCGILCCDKKNTAKVLFEMLCEMSRCDPKLNFLCVQYTVDRVADPITEAKDAEIEYRRQEEVLKRFRMHDCNLLIGTAVLEEGIDLPKCNLVIRWDPPSNYRSYVQCKGRARAVNAHHIILVAPSPKATIAVVEENVGNSEKLSDFCHQILCRLTEEQLLDDDDANITKSASENEESEECKIYEDDVQNELAPIGDIKTEDDNVHENIATLSESNSEDELVLEENNDKLEICELEDLSEENEMLYAYSKLELSPIKTVIIKDSKKLNGCLGALDMEKLDDAIAQITLKKYSNDNTNSLISSSNTIYDLPRLNADGNDSSKCIKIKILNENNSKSNNMDETSAVINITQKLNGFIGKNKNNVSKLNRDEDDSVVIVSSGSTSQESTSNEKENSSNSTLSSDDIENIDDNDSSEKIINIINNEFEDLNDTVESKIHPFRKYKNIDDLDLESLDDLLAKLSTSRESNDNLNTKLTPKITEINTNTCLALEKFRESEILLIENVIITEPQRLIVKEPFQCKVKDILTVESESLKFQDSSLNEMENSTNLVVDRLAEYREIEKILIEKCANTEPDYIEHLEADRFTLCVEPYKPMPDILTGVSVNLGNAIALVNKYCAKLPSDTFTKLTPLWRCTRVMRNKCDMFQYTIRLPINSPLKYDIVGLPMPTNVLARRIAALLTCKELHKTGELDNNLQPIGKEGFRAAEPDWEIFDLEDNDKKIVQENSEPRPGTTKRRQYYYKRIASEFSNCRPTVNTKAYLYIIKLTLQCPIPEEQNTRGRKIYPPEEAYQGFGILTLKKIPKVSAFPIFTRSGEVKVSIELSKTRIVLTEEQINRINIFINYTFTNVLRLQKFLMLFDGNATENSIFIVPTVKKSYHEIVIDWKFLEEICKNCDKMPTPIPDELRKKQKFDPNRFKDAVVMPWYRNQDQPQYFYVAEICQHLSPESSFPGENYTTFQEYYFLKYNITIQNTKQPLLDVDHTSARLNFLTPRYVNRKGVALPTSSEETKRAKRENLEQKQILVPELCTIHPFPASLWRAAVCLPCILYRINGLLLADEIRKKVSFDLGLGQQDIVEESFEWPILDFGWSLAEVLRKSKDELIELELKGKQATDADIKIDLDNFGKSGNKKEKNEFKKNESDSPGKKIIEDEIGEKSVNDILAEADEKLKADTFIEIGTWSNDMANNVDSDSDLENEWGILPPNVNMCSTNNTKIRYGSPTSWDMGKSGRSSSNQRHNDKYFSDSDGSYQSDDEYDNRSFHGEPEIETEENQSGPIRIEFKSNNVAEAIETEEEILKRQKQLAIIQETSLNDKLYQLVKNLESGFELQKYRRDLLYFSESYSKVSSEFSESTREFKEFIWSSGLLRRHNEILEFPKKEIPQAENYRGNLQNLQKLLPYLSVDVIRNFLENKKHDFDPECTVLTLNDMTELNALFLSENSNEEFEIIGNGDIFDNFNDNQTLKIIENDKKLVSINFNRMNSYSESDQNILETAGTGASNNLVIDFSFDYQPNLVGHPGPSPSIILQALTMSNANDGINLERLETIGDSFLKYAITSYLYCTYENVHEGKLSHLRSKQVSNLNLYRLGRKKVLGECMIATKFEPHDNWLPPCYYVPKELEKALIEAKIPPCHWNLADLPNIKNLSSEEICELVRKKAESLGLFDEDGIEEMNPPESSDDDEIEGNFTCFIPYNLVTQHSIPDKSVADCVEALIGAYLIECGPRGALLFMAWLGVRVLPMSKKVLNLDEERVPGSTLPDDTNEITIYGEWQAPKSPLLHFSPNPYMQLNILLDGFSQFEEKICYNFKDRSYLLQAMTHASYSPNRLTDCYQRLEFLGDAVLDYLITRHLYEDPRQHSPGALTDLRSALVNNTIFASLAVRHGFHKYFRHLSPGLNEVIDRFVRIQHENGHVISEEYYLLSEEECDDAEDVEVPKALGDVFESVAGAIFLDSNMSLDMVWKVYSNMMKPEIEQFSNSVPKSPIRELLELEPETAKFGRPEKLADGRRVRVTVEVFGKGIFRGIGRNYRIAKCTAAKCALKQLKKQGLISKRH